MNVETITDIAAELRERAEKWTKEPEFAKLFEQYADRIENASEHVYEKGRTDGYDRGYSDGYSKGYDEAKDDAELDDPELYY